MKRGIIDWIPYFELFTIKGCLIRKKHIPFPLHEYAVEMNWFSAQSRMLRKMNYARNMDGMIHRYFREQNGWDIHCTRTKEFICRFVESLNNHKEVMVLGSGWLLDVPVEFLAKKYSKIYLADILHPPQVVHKYKHFTNINFIQTDLTGGFVEAVFKIPNSKSTQRNPLDPDLIKPLADTNFIQLFSNKEVHSISVNLLSQLDGMIVDYLAARINDQLEGLISLRKRIQEKHLNLLLQQDHFCLISDFTEKYTHKISGGSTKNRLILADWPAGNLQQQWEWDFDTDGSYYKDHVVKMTVKATAK